MKARFVLAALAAFALLHQDAWLWDDASLALGFLPYGLAYHAAYSLATAALWAAAVRYGWPDSEEAPETEPDAGGPAP